MSLPRLLDIGQEEWTAFVEGRLLSPSLLIKLLAYKYRKQKQIQVNQALRRIVVDDTVKVPLPPLLAPDSVPLYELSVIVYILKNSPSIGLLVRGKAYPFVLFVGAPSLVDKSADDNEVKYIVNEAEGSEYFVFDFLSVYTGTQKERLKTSNHRELATIMIDELGRPRYFRESLITLYKEIDQLLTSGGGDISSKVETKKQAFYEIVLHTIKMVSAKIKTTVDDIALTDKFLFIPAQSQADPIPLDATHSDDLFKEMLPLIEFLWLVVATTPGQAMLVIRGVEYNANQVKIHLFSLTERILSNVDRLNAESLTIDQVMAHQLGFTQRDYERLTSQDSSFITYNVMAHFFRDKLLLVGGLRRLLQLRTHGQLMLWVIEEEEEERESNLVVLFQPEKTRPYRQSIYVHNQLLTTTDVQKTLQEANIRSYNRQIDIADKENMDSTWYIALLIQRLSSGPLPPQMRELLLAIQSEQVIKVQESILRRVQRDILSLVLTEPRAIPPPKVERRIVQSKVSNWLELQDTGKFVNDAVIIDIVKTMHIGPRFYVFDPLFWSRTVFTGLVKEVLSKFKNPSIEVLLVPMNENDVHWSLGIIDMRLGVVSFYTSVKNRGYFKVFTPIMTSFLKMQTPGMEYQFLELTDQECQQSNSLDCSIYVLNKISQLCVLPDKRVFYTRKSVTAYIKEGLLKQSKDGVWYNFSTDLLNFMEQYPARRSEYTKQLIYLLLASYGPQEVYGLFGDLFTNGKLVKSNPREIEAQFKARLSPEKKIDVFT